jgi:hypothetical protein
VSYASVKNALTPLLLLGVSGLANVRDRNQIDRLLPPVNLMPLVLLRDRPHTEVPLASGAADRSWWLECVLWAAFQTDQDQAPFDAMREQLESVLRTNPLLGGSAGDAGTNTQLIVSGRSLQSHDYPAVSVNGQTYRHCLIATLVREIVTFPGV